MENQAKNLSPVLIDEDSEAFLNIRGPRQGQDLLERALLSNDIEGVRFYLNAMADRWPEEAAQTLGSRVFKEDLTGENAFFDQVLKEAAAHPEIEKRVFDEARALTVAVMNSDYDRALLLMDRGFELPPHALSYVLKSQQATDDTLAWMQAASPAAFERSLGSVAMKDLLSDYVSEDKLRYVLEQAPRELKERLASAPEARAVLHNPAGIRISRVLSETGFEFNGDALKRSPEMFAAAAFRGSISPEDAEFFAKKLAPVLKEANTPLGAGVLRQCESVAMLREVLPLLEAPKNEAERVAFINDLSEVLSIASTKADGKDMLAVLKGAYALEYANVEPRYDSARTAEGPVSSWNPATLAVIEVFGPDKLHEKYTLNDWLALQTGRVAEQLSTQLKNWGIDVDMGKADFHRAVSCLGESYPRTVPATSLMGQALKQNPERMGERNEAGFTVADWAMLSNVKLAHEGLPKEAVQAHISAEIGGVPMAHAFVRANPDSRLSDWQNAAQEHGFDLAARDGKGRTVAHAKAEAGATAWIFHASWNYEVHQMMHATDAEGNNLLHAMARGPQQITGSPSYYQEQAFKRLVELGVPLHAPNAEGKTALELYRARPDADKAITRDMEQTVLKDIVQRQFGVLEYQLVGLSESGQRAHLKFNLVKTNAEDKRTVIDVTSKVASVLVSERLVMDPPYEAKAKAVQVFDRGIERKEGEDPQAFRQRAADVMAGRALETVNLLNQSRGLTAIQDYAQERQQKDAEREQAKKAKQAGKGLSV